MKRWIAVLLAVLLAVSAFAMALGEADVPPETVPEPIEAPQITEPPAETVPTEQPEAADMPTTAPTDKPEAEPTDVPEPPVPSNEPQTAEPTAAPVETVLTLRFADAAGAALFETQEITAAAGEQLSERLPEAAGLIPSMEQRAAEGTGLEIRDGKLCGSMPKNDTTIEIRYVTGLKLTIHYVLQNGTAAAPDHTVTDMQPGDSYDVASPQMKGVRADQEKVSGTMSFYDVEITVQYSVGPDGMHGWRGNSGFSGMDGMPADPGFRVTPGEAFTSIHSGSGDAALYGVIKPEDAEAVYQLNITVDETQDFLPEFAEETLTLTAESGVWLLDGRVLRTLAESGAEFLRLKSGNTSVMLPTAGFVQGYAYDCLRMKGLASAEYIYEIDPESGMMTLTADGTTLHIAEDGDVQPVDVVFETEGA